MVCTRTLIRHMSISCDKTFSWVQIFLTAWSWHWCLTYLSKTLTLAISFDLYVQRLWYFRYMGTSRFDLVTLTLVFDLHIVNLNHAYIWMVYNLLRSWYFTWDFLWQVLLLGTNKFALVTLTLMFDLLRNLTLSVTSERYVLGLWYFTWVFLETRPSRLQVLTDMTLWPCPSCLTYIFKKKL
jgi:hypothetical protein